MVDEQVLQPFGRIAVGISGFSPIRVTPERTPCKCVTAYSRRLSVGNWQCHEIEKSVDPVGVPDRFESRR
ncbi:hypothetical protein HPB50_022058 [Hyalomma asiaticum]|uniref:Uncharacterized protein n=1 Tax=Hyalomma asiaticum TaxID=266040 RepID=A0ACB7S7Z9_HYAAI|nr:hypothetical protein HPB50_022058 [Hyalomma asiaticum]